MSGQCDGQVTGCTYPRHQKEVNLHDVCFDFRNHGHESALVDLCQKCTLFCVSFHECVCGAVEEVTDVIFLGRGSFPVLLCDWRIQNVRYDVKTLASRDAFVRIT